MQSYRSFLIVLILLIFQLLIVKANGQNNINQLRYDEQINVILNYTYNKEAKPETKSIEKLLKNKSGVNGFIFKLSLNSDSSGINYLSPTNVEYDFAEVCNALNNFCERDTSRVLTLFFDYHFDSSFLIQFLRKHNCTDKIWSGIPDIEWPTVESLLAKKNRLVCFSLNNKTNTPLIKFLWDYAAEPSFSTDIEPKLHGEFMRGYLKNKLLFLSSYTLYKDRRDTDDPYKTIDVNENPYFVGYAINIWKNTGKRPTFIIINKFATNFNGLRSHIIGQRSISGTISYNRKPVNKVFWEGNFNSVTYGEYCFPATLSEDITLKPITPGFRFIPEEINVEEISDDVIQNFLAVPMDLHNNMVAYLPFNNNTEDKGPNKFPTTNNGSKIVLDKNRNEVAEFNGKSFITLPGTNTIGISNSDFTVSAWIKLATNNTKIRREFAIMGTKDTYYRGGLHLQIRNNKPYFGFYSNDLSGETELAPNRWYHIVWRYTKYNQEQAIFVNGKEDGASLNHPAFVSNSNLVIGQSLGRNNLFEGQIDDIVIWNRALGEDEIWNLYQDVFFINDTNLFNYLRRNKYWLSFGLLLIVVLLVIYYKKRFKPFNLQQNKAIEKVELTYHAPTTNAIKLFGEFQVIDKNGVDITDKFTPRLKQIFILLIIASKEKSNGISTDDFLNIIWPSFERKKAINNRGVSISKLRHLLESLDGIKICNNQERWKISITGDIHCDYYNCLEKFDADLFNDRDNLNTFLGIVQRGVFLQDSVDPWLDEIKGKVTNKVIDILTRLLNEFDLNQNPQLVIQIADRILIADDINEEALRFKIKALLILRQSNQAKFIYKSFKDRYLELYNEQFPQSFEKLSQ